jgi:hypothetical protein
MTSDNGRHLTKVSTAGEVIWSRLMQGVTSLFPAGSGFLMIVHNTNTLARLNDLGEVVWWRTFNFPVYPTLARALPDGTILIGTHANAAGNVPFIAKLTAGGQIVWQMSVTIPGMTDAYLTDLLPLNDGSFLASMPAYDWQDGGIASSGDYLVRFSSSGALVWAKTLIGVGQSSSGWIGVTELGETEGGYFALAGSLLIELDPTGDVKHFRTRLPSSERGVTPTLGGGYMVAGTDFSVGRAVLQHIDRELNNRWLRRFETGGTSKLFSIASSPAGGWIVGGTITPPGKSDSDAWLFRLGPGGQPFGSCPESSLTDSHLGNGFQQCEVQLVYPSPPPSLPIASVINCDPPPVPAGFSPIPYDFDFICGPGTQANAVKCTVTTRSNYSGTFYVSARDGSGDLNVAPNSSASIDLLYRDDSPPGIYSIIANSGINITSGPAIVAIQPGPPGTTVQTPTSWLPYSLSRTLLCSGAPEVCPSTATLEGEPEPDSDGDSLSDCIERNGVTDGSGNMILDLPRLGADPYHKDIFVEVDYVSGVGHDHMPLEASMELAVGAIAALPADNPDGTRGVDLHIDYWHEDHPENNWPDSGANSFAVYDDQLLTWAHIDLLKDVELSTGKVGFSQERRGIFHYAVFGHATARLDGNEVVGASRPKAIWRGFAGRDFMVTLGDRPKDKNWEASTFLHELGHNLGLKHGGMDRVENKPNYRSVMNYLYDRDVRFSGEALPPAPAQPLLDENLLIEGDGIGATGETFYYCPRFATCRYPGATQIDGLDLCKAPDGSEIDWNCNGQIDQVDVDANISGDETSFHVPILSDLVGFSDSVLVFDGIRSASGSRSTGAGKDDDPEPEPPRELTADEYDAMPDPVHQVVEAVFPVIQLAWGETRPAFFRIANVGFRDDTYEPLAYSTAGYLLAGAQGPFRPLPISVPGGGSVLLEIPITAPVGGVPSVSQLVLRVTGELRPEFADEVFVQIDVRDSSPDLFGDGFESGDSSAWSADSQ